MKNSKNAHTAAPLPGDLDVELAFVSASLAWWSNPLRLWWWHTDLQWSYLQLYAHAACRMAGVKLPPLVVPEEGDRRFLDAEWDSNPWFDYSKQLYLLNARQLVEAARKATSSLPMSQRLALRIIVDQTVKALSPSRFAMTSPEGWQETARTAGFNLARRFNRLLFDMDRRNGLFRVKVTDAADYHPGGNDTYLCVSEGETRSAYRDVDELIRNRQPHFEQGGFLEPCQSPAVTRLQMAGGEFCGNAARCVAAWVANEYFGKRRYADLIRYDAVEQVGNRLEFRIEVSGASRPLSAHCLRMGEDFWVEVEMPVGSRLRHTKHAVEFDGKPVPVHKVEMEGIVHLVIDQRKLPFNEAPSTQRKLLEKLETELQLSNEPAIGLIWSNADDQRGAIDISIDPVVFVRATDSLIYESACGSGSLAAAIVHCSADKRSSTTSVKQPSANAIAARLVKKDGVVQEAYISGVVELRGMFSAPAA